MKSRITSSLCSLRVRDIEKTDADAVNAIQNYYVEHTTATLRTELWTLAERLAWIDKRSAAYPGIVAEVEGRVVGWGSLSPHEDSNASPQTAETTIYVQAEFHRQGIGGMILGELIQRARRTGHRALLAACCAESVGSIALHDKLGFMQIARLPATVKKFGRTLDIVCLGVIL